MTKPLLDIRNLKVNFYTEEGVVPAVDGLDLQLHEGETLAVVGESGCGKTVTSLSALRLIPNPPGKIEAEGIVYNGQNLLTIREREMRKIRGNSISMIFQEPMTSLNPVFTVGKQIRESLKYHQGMKKKEAETRAIEMLRLVGIPDPDRAVCCYPHQLSGGMRQRVMIAMALACNPRILIADEPTTALDVTIQAQIVRLLIDLKEKTGVAILLITHDLGVVAQIADNALVMYAGEAVEYADCHSIFKDPLHPYTVGLLRSIPRMDKQYNELYNIKGTLPSPEEYPLGCRFSSRCDVCMDKCLTVRPPLFFMPDGRKVRCHRYEEVGVANA